MAKNLLSSLGISKRTYTAANIAPAKEITQASTYMYGAGTTTVATLLGSGRRQARARQQVYEKWALMESDAVISSALMLLVTTALGGHETTGQMVFIEQNPKFHDNKKMAQMAEEINTDLVDLFNRVAVQVAYTGCAFGDSFARIYSDGRGVIDLYTDEMVRPPLVQSFERGSRTVGYAVYTGDRNFERLNVEQLARCKMPRTQWVPQNGVIEKSLKVALTEDDVDKLPLMPSMAGGSLLYAAEEAYDNFSASLNGLVTQRWMDSINEKILTVNVDGMTKEHQERFLGSIVTMVKKTKAIIESAVKNGVAVSEKITHILPVDNEKQVVQISSPNSENGRSSNISIEDVILHARLMTGAVGGVDLSMIGFSDQLNGGLGGDGGFTRTSAQMAERARVIRTSLVDFFNDIIDIHTMNRYGVVFKPSERPWKLNFYGSISALESERQRTKADSMNSGLLLVGAIQQLKDAGATKEMMQDFLTNEMMLDEEQAKLYAPIVDVKPPAEGEGGGGLPG
ncbi:MAG: hypothetical protein M0Q44_01470 [Methylobacter sp.]|jgi:hypothetical protein|nr:hypothetical protein [Methylobacter sp.]